MRGLFLSRIIGPNETVVVDDEFQLLAEIVSDFGGDAVGFGPARKKE